MVVTLISKPNYTGVILSLFKVAFAKKEAVEYFKVIVKS